MWVQYVKENIFNVYSKDENGWFVPVILDAECEISEDKKDTLIVRTDHHSFQVEYFMDTKEYNVVT